MSQKYPVDSVPPFLRLSPEILRLAFGYFCPHCRGDYKQAFRDWDSSSRDNIFTLHSLCLVARYFRVIAQEILHHVFDVTWCRTLHSSPWERFLRTIASRPDLARSVNAVVLRPIVVKRLNYNNSRDVFHACAQLLGTTAPGIYPTRQTDQRQGPSSIEKAFFLGQPMPDRIKAEECIPIIASELLTITVAILPRLTHLGFAPEELYDITYDEYPIPSLLWALDISPSTLDALGVTTLPLKTLESDHGLPELMRRATSVKTLITSANSQFHNMKSLEELHISTYDHLSRTGMQRCISACTGNLSTFSYTASNPDSANVIESLTKMGLHNGLKSIKLDLRCWPTCGYISPISSFQLFSKVTTLVIPACPIYGSEYANLNPQSLVDILPPNVESLTIVEHETPTPPGLLHQDLQRLASVKTTRFRNLREIISDSIQLSDEDLAITSHSGQNAAAYGPTMAVAMAISLLGIIITTALGPEYKGSHFELAKVAGREMEAKVKSGDMGMDHARINKAEMEMCEDVASITVQCPKLMGVV
ncbi:hypothetical protein F53441_4947 [Fusarium austroafricanum]|uniref:Uncharacterized protein n=1 Tax=Fusarium austroafricanum TaxID=2364996 RepID=A0A8H4P8W1_9HYPO|nr:hypothetical protein F53441_4947 [Fusarium austroafricanum]